MRGYLPSFEMESCKSLKQALKIKSELKDKIKLFAGGTDIMVLFAAGKLSGAKYLDISKIKELKKIKINKKYIEIGALVTFAEIREHKIIAKEFPNLIEAAKETGAIAIQNRGTIGGNIANASPAADTPPALLCYDAEINLMSLSGKRTLNYNDFHVGYKVVSMNADEIIYSIKIPRVKSKMFHFYRKVGTRKAQAISKICFSAKMHLQNSKIKEIKIAMGSVAPKPLRCLNAEKYLISKSIKSISMSQLKSELNKDISPIHDIRSTQDYRLLVSQNIIEQFICGIG